MLKRGISVNKMDRLMEEYAKGADNFEQLAVCMVGLAQRGEEFLLVTRSESDGIHKKHSFCCAGSNDQGMYIAVYTRKQHVPKQKGLYIKRIPMAQVFEFVLGHNDLDGIIFNPDRAPVIFGRNCIAVLSAAVQKR